MTFTDQTIAYHVQENLFNFSKLQTLKRVNRATHGPNNWLNQRYLEVQLQPGVFWGRFGFAAPTDGPPRCFRPSWRTSRLRGCCCCGLGRTSPSLTPLVQPPLGGFFLRRWREDREGEEGRMGFLWWLGRKKHLLRRENASPLSVLSSSVVYGWLLDSFS